MIMDFPVSLVLCVIVGLPWCCLSQNLQDVAIHLPRRRMTIDGVEINGGVVKEGYISCTVKIGPNGGQDFDVILDTGSPLCIIPCGNCHNCGHHAQLLHAPLKHNSKSFDIHYVEGSRCAGKFIDTTVKIHDTSFSAKVGCASTMTNLFRTQHADGIMGLDAESILAQFMIHPHDHLQLFPSFALRLNPDHPESDRLLLGVDPNSFRPTKDVVDCHMFSHTENFYTHFQQLSIGDKPFQPRSSKILIDSGTTYNYFEFSLFQHIRQVLQDDYGFHTNSKSEIGCVLDHLITGLPDIVVHGENSQCTITLQPHQWSIVQDNGWRCAAIYDTGFGNDNTLGLLGLDYRQTTFVFGTSPRIYMENLNSM
jgi:hypothetical protein